MPNLNYRHEDLICRQLVPPTGLEPVLSVRDSPWSDPFVLSSWSELTRVEIFGGRPSIGANVRCAKRARLPCRKAGSLGITGSGLSVRLVVLIVRRASVVPVLVETDPLMGVVVQARLG